MALVVKDRIKETSSTTGQGTLTLGGAVDGFLAFGDANAGIGDGNTTFYVIVDGNNFETGIGTYTSSGNTLSRDTVLTSSATNRTDKISCTGSQEVFVSQPADKAFYLDNSLQNNLAINGTDNYNISTTGYASFTGNIFSAGGLTLTDSGNNPTITFREHSQIDPKAQIVGAEVDTDNGTLVFKTQNATTMTTALTIDQTQNATFNNNVNVGTSSKTTDTDVKLINDNKTFGIRADRAGSYFSVVDFSAGQNRLVIDTSGNVGIGVIPVYKFHQHESTSGENYHLFTNSTTGQSSSDGFRIGIDSNENALIWHREANSIQFATSNDQKMEIDSSGRVTVSEVGTDTTLSGGQPALQVTGSGFDGYMAAVRRDSSAFSSGIILAKSRNTTADNFTIVQDNDQLGSILFIGDDGTDLDTYGAYITAEVNGTPASNNMPTDLVFATNGGSASATERMRIGKSGEVIIGTDVGSYTTSDFNVFVSNADQGTTLCLYDDSGAYHSALIEYDTNILSLGLNNANSANTLLTSTAINIGSDGVGIGMTPGSARGGYTDLVIGEGGDQPQIELYHSSASWAINNDGLNSNQLGFHYNNGSSWSQRLALTSTSAVFAGGTTTNGVASHQNHIDVNSNYHIYWNMGDIGIAKNGYVGRLRSYDQGINGSTAQLRDALLWTCNDVNTTTVTVDASSAQGSDGNAWLMTNSKGYYWNGIHFNSTNGHIGGLIGKNVGGPAPTEIKLNIGGSYPYAGITVFTANFDGTMTMGEKLYLDSTGVQFSDGTTQTSAGASVAKSIALASVTF